MHQEAFHTEVPGKWKDNIMPEDLKYSEKNCRNNQEEMKQESRPDKNSELREGADVGTPINLHFNGRVRMAANGKALTVGVAKKGHLQVATKEQLHITIAYHATMEFPKI